jgi:hypothetical protein
VQGTGEVTSKELLAPLDGAVNEDGIRVNTHCDAPDWVMVIV